MSEAWESTTLLRITDVAYIRTESAVEGHEIQESVECPHCHRDTHWLIAASGDHVDITCRCGHRWQVRADLSAIIGLAEHLPISPQWRSLDDAQRALGFQPDRPNGRQHNGAAGWLLRRFHHRPESV